MMKRLSNNEIEEELMALTTNDVLDCRWDKVPGKWLGTNGDPRNPLSNDVLAAFAKEAQRLKRPLTDTERAAITAKFKV